MLSTTSYRLSSSFSHLGLCFWHIGNTLPAQRDRFFHLTCSDLVSSEVFDHLKERGDSELLGNDIRLEDAGGSVSSFSGWLAGAATKSD